MNPLFVIQQELVEEIQKIPVIKNAIGDAGAIPVHLWRGSNLTNELEAALKQVGFGIVVKAKGFNQIRLDHWAGSIQVGMQINDHFTHGGWGKDVSGMDVAWEIARFMEKWRQSGSTTPFTNVSAQVQESQQKHIENILITARVEWTMQPNQ